MTAVSSVNTQRQVELQILFRGTPQFFSDTTWITSRLEHAVCKTQEIRKEKSVDEEDSPAATRLFIKDVSESPKSHRSRSGRKARLLSHGKSRWQFICLTLRAEALEQPCVAALRPQVKKEVRTDTSPAVFLCLQFLTQRSPDHEEAWEGPGLTLSRGSCLRTGQAVAKALRYGCDVHPLHAEHEGRI